MEDSKCLLFLLSVHTPCDVENASAPLSRTVYIPGGGSLFGDEQTSTQHELFLETDEGKFWFCVKQLQYSVIIHTTIFFVGNSVKQLFGRTRLPHYSRVESVHGKPRWT